ncbi:MAG: hypothetical protein B2I17_09380 [Thermoplasmatales archaeon B_DKE]|nr:MAG: hypothetical protein B2I17_09380 [Thermoplasmatales archaeon B_DKE]
MGLHSGIRARWGIIAFIFAGALAIVSTISYETTLLGMTFLTKSTTSETGYFINKYVYYPHFFGPILFFAAGILAAVGLVFLILYFIGKRKREN